MCDIRVSGRGVSITTALRQHATEKLTDAVKVFDIEPMTCDVVLRCDKNKSNPDSNVCEVTVKVPKSVVRVSVASRNMYDAIDESASKVSRQLRKYKTKLLDKHKRQSKKTGRVALEKMTEADIAALTPEVVVDDDALVREKVIRLDPMSLEEALVQIDLIGHDFYMFEDSATGLVNVVYRRENGGYGVLRPDVSEEVAVA